MTKIYRLIFFASLLLAASTSFAQDEDCDVFSLLPPLVNNQLSTDPIPVPCGFDVGTQFYVNECSPCGSKISDDNCTDAPNPTLCELDGFMTTTTGYSNDLRPETANFCGGGTGTHNNFWIGFTAQTSVVELRITTFNCASQGNARGIQVAIAETNCIDQYQTVASSTNTGNAACTGSISQGGLFNASVDLGSTNLIPGNPYYILIDGFAGGVCDLTIDVLDGFGVPEYDISTINPGALCPDVLGNAASPVFGTGAQVDVTVGGIATTDLTYFWLDPMGNVIATTAGTPTGPTTVTGMLDGSFFTQEGTYSVQVIDNGSCCPLCTTVDLPLDDPPPAVAAVVVGANGAEGEFNCTNETVIVTGGPDGNITPVVEQFQIEDANGVREQLDVHNVSVDGRLTEITITRETIEEHFPGADNGSIRIVYGFLESFTDFCFADAFVEIPFDFRQPDIDIDNPADLDCGSNPTVEINASNTSSADNHNTGFNWEPADGTSSIAGADTDRPVVTNNGKYYVTVTDLVNGCTAVDSIDVGGMVDPPILQAIAPVTLDCNTTTMLVSTTGDAGGAGISYSWMGPDGSDLGISVPELTADTEGTYILTAVNDVNSCQSQTSFNVIIDMPTLAISNVRDSVLNCNVQQITFPDAIVDGGGVMGYTYSWMDPSMTEISTDAGFTADVDGTYTLLVTDVQTGCDMTITREIILDMDEPLLDALPNDLVLTCTNNSMVSAIANATDDMGGAITNLTYEWFQGDVSTGTSIGTDAQIGFTAEGTYTVLVTNPSNGCTSMLPIIIDENIEEPDAEILDPDNITCDADMVMLQSSSMTTGSLSYQWLQGDENGTPLGTAADQEVSADGAYTLIITNDENGCTTIANTTVGMDMMAPTAEAGLDQIINCNNLTTGVQLDGTGSGGIGTLTYQWMAPDMSDAGNAETINVLTEGLYTLIITDSSNGCTSMETVLVSLDDTAPENVTATDGIISCTDPNLTLMGSTSSTGNFAFCWTDAGNNPFPDGETLDISQAGTYTFTVKDLDNGCSTAVNTLIENDSDTPSAIPMQIAGTPGELSCNNPTITWEGQGIGNDPNLDIQWEGPDGPISGALVMFDQNTTPGQYTLTVTAPNGCSAEADITPSFNFDTPVIDLTAGTIFCDPEQVTLTATDVIAGSASFTWTDPNGNQLTQGLSNPTVMEPGMYMVEAVGDNGCVTTDMIEVFDSRDMPVVSVAPDFALTCMPGEDTYALGGGATTSNPSDVLDFVWTRNGTDISTDPNFIADEDGTYVLTVTNTINGCQDAQTVVVDDVRQNPLATAGTQMILNCNTPMVLLEGDSDDPNAVYEWTSPSGLIVNEQSPMIDEPGEWMLTVTSLNGCEGMAMWDVQADFDLPQDVGIMGDNLLTCDANSVQLFGSTSTMDLGSDPYSWSLAGDPTTVVSNQQNPNFGAAGDYVLTITGANGCVETAQFSIASDENLPTPGAAVDRMITCDDENTMIIGSSTAANTSYSWSGPLPFTGATTKDIVVTAAGIYTLTIIDDENGCESTIDAVVEDDLGEPEVMTIGTDLTCEDGAIFSLSASSTSPMVSYSWTGPNNFVSTDANPVITDMGTYEVIVTDLTNGCETVETADANDIRDLPADRIFGASVLTLTCDDMMSELNASSSTTNVIFTWNGPGVDNVEASTLEVSELGVYEVTFTDPANGCTITEQVPVEQNIDPPFIEGLPTDMLNCQVDEVALGVNTDEGIREYLWVGPSATALSDPTAANPMALEPGMYTVTVIAEDNGCEQTTTIDVFQDMNIPVSMPSSTVITCDDPIAQLIGTGSTEGDDITYEWTGPNGFRSTDLNATTDVSGEYFLTVFNSANLCEIPQSIMVEINVTEPTADAGLDADFACADDFVSLVGSGTGQGPLSYEWTNASATVIGNTAEIDVVESGTFTLQVTDGENGCIMTDMVEITPDEDKPVIDIEMPLVLTCNTMEVALDADGTTGTGQGALNFTWTDPVGGNAGDQSTIMVTEPGTYTLFVSDDSNGCDETRTVEVIQDIIPPAFMITGGEIDCVQGSTTVSIDMLSTNATFSWEGPNNFTATTEDLSGIDMAGPYSVTVTDVNNGCETVRSTIVTSSMDIPQASIDEPEMLDCDTEVIQLVGNAANGLSFSWSGPGIISDPTTLTPMINEAGTYELIVTDPANGCSTIDRVDVEENSNVITAINPIGDDVNCFGPNTGSIEISSDLVTGGDAPYVYSIDGGDSFGTQEDFLGLTEGMYEVVVMDINGCTWPSTVTINPALELALELGDNQVISFGDSIRLNPNTNFDIDVAEWSDTLILGNTPFVRPTSTTSYEITAFDEDGCVITDNITIFVEKTRPVYIPSAFSPNRDGANDFFTVYADINLITSINDLAIYDRWGEQVFFQETMTPADALLEVNGWNGTFRTEDMSPGVYVYKVLVEFIDGEEILYEGDITLIR